MTRPPFAEFSSLAIRELTAWIGGEGYNALWIWSELGIEHLRH